MGSIFDSIVTAVMEPAKAVAAEQPAPAPVAPATPPAAPASAARSGGPARSAGAAAVGAAVSAAVAQAGAAAPPASTPKPTAPVLKTRAEVEAAIAAIAATRKETFNWKQSIVDLMKLLQLDSSLGARKQLAQELGYDGKLDGSAEMTLWLHKQVMQKLASGDYGTAPARGGACRRTYSVILPR